MSDQQTPSWTEALRQFFRIRLPYNPGVAEEIVPTQDVSEIGWLSTVHPRWCAGASVVAAGGAGTNAMSVWIPVARQGIVSRLSHVIVTVPANAQVSIRIEREADTGIAAVTADDTRFLDLRINSVPTTFVGQATPLIAAVPGTLILEMSSILGFTPTMIPIPAVGHAGGGVIVVNDEDNVRFGVGWVWREYLLEDV